MVIGSGTLHTQGYDNDKLLVLHEWRNIHGWAIGIQKSIKREKGSEHLYALVKPQKCESRGSVNMYRLVDLWGSGNMYGLVELWGIWQYVWSIRTVGIWQYVWTSGTVWGSGNMYVLVELWYVSHTMDHLYSPHVHDIEYIVHFNLGPGCKQEKALITNMQALFPAARR